MPAEHRRTGLIAALDTADVATARRWAGLLRGSADRFKLGLEFFAGHGPDGVRAVGAASVFLDLKLHDIPNTVAGAVRGVLPLCPSMLTLHASGGAAMIAAARAALEAEPDPPMLLAVTVLTSLDEAALAATGVAAGPVVQVVRLARLAIGAGADGIVCSGAEIAPVRDALGGGPVLVVPGIRPAGAASGDQARVMTPGEAARAGADWIVVGRPITGAADPAAAAAAIRAELS